MSTPEQPPRDAGNWAQKVDRLEVSADKAGVGYNVTGKRAVGPQQGFGRLWQRTYDTEIPDAPSAEEVIADWKVRFGDYWPGASTFHNSLTGIAPGDVAPIEVGLASHGPRLATGIYVIYADDESFTFMTPEGHMFAGMITFSAESLPGRTRVEIKILIRPNDPLWELAWPIARHKEDVFWMGTLRNLAAHYGHAEVKVREETECIDRKRLWSNWRNIWHNSGIRSAIHVITAPARWVRRPAQV